MMNNVFLLLGSNLGNPLENLNSAKESIIHSVGSITKKSSVYRTAPWGVTNQPEFLNQVIVIETPFSPGMVLTRTMLIEQQMGRIRKEKWGSRSIDIDILFYNNEIIKQNDLTIPHPGIPYRKFTLEPLAEIAPEFLHPELNITIAELLNECEDDANVVRTDL